MTAQAHPEITVYAQTAIPGGERTRYHVYFSDLPITADTVLHEAVHSASLLDDDQLAEKAKVPVGSESSGNFNDALKQNCF